MKYLKEILIEIDKKYICSFSVKQLDTARYLLFRILNDGVAFNLSDKKVRAYIKKPDETEVFNDMEIANEESGLAELKLTEQMLAIPGIAKVEISIYEGEDILTTIPFDLTIVETIRDDRSILSSNEYKTLTNALKEIDDIDKKFAEVGSQIDEIASTGTTVEAVQNKVQEMAEAGEIQAYTIEDGGIHTSKYKNKSITPEKTSFLICGKNIFNKNDTNIINGQYYNENGNKVIDINYSDYTIEVKGGETYTLSGVPARQCYLNYKDLDGNRLGGLKILDNIKTITLDDNVAFLQIGYYTSSFNTIQIELGSSATKYEEYYNKLNNIRYEGDLYGKANIDKMTFFSEDNVNLFNIKSKETLLDKNINGTGNIGDMVGWRVTNYIDISNINIIGIGYELNTSQNSQSTFVGYLALYSELNVRVSPRIDWINDTRTLDLTKLKEKYPTAKYIRFTYNYSRNTSRLIIYNAEDNTIQPYTNYGYNMEYLNIKKSNIPSSFSYWYNKKWVSIGDSNTSRRLYQAYVVQRLGLQWVNYAAGGTDASYWADDEKLAKIVAEKPDVVTIMLGTNTGMNDGELPTNNISIDYEWDTTTYVGAMCYMIKYIHQALPYCHILLLTPPYATNKNAAVEYFSEGIYSKIDLLEKIALRYGCEFVNVYNIASMYNFSVFFDNENDGVHFNELYGKRLANKIIAKLIELENVENSFF